MLSFQQHLCRVRRWGVRGAGDSGGEAGVQAADDVAAEAVPADVEGETPPLPALRGRQG